jgi:hypothetical protein
MTEKTTGAGASAATRTRGAVWSTPEMDDASIWSEFGSAAC